MKIEGWPARWLIALGFRLVQLWARTLRFELDDRTAPADRTSEPRIWAVWHNRVLLFPYVIRRFKPTVEGAALISASRDGALLAEFVQRYGFTPVRGSSSRRGASAMLQLTEVLAKGGNIAITPDGPRGPVYQLSPGIVFLAQSSGVPVISLNLEYASCWRLRSWDRFFVPKPFSRVRLTFSPAQHVRPTTTAEEFEAERQRLQSAMMESVETH